MRAVLAGEFDRQAFVALGARLVDHPGVKPHVDILFDARGLTMAGISASDIQNLGSDVAPLRRQRGAARTAWVAGDDVGFGMMRMYELAHEAARLGLFMVFRDLGAAEAWLTEGREDPRARPTDAVDHRPGLAPALPRTDRRRLPATIIGACSTLL